MPYRQPMPTQEAKHAVSSQQFSSCRSMQRRLDEFVQTDSRYILSLDNVTNAEPLFSRQRNKPVERANAVFGTNID
jgi:hypothetical protein